MALRLPNLGPRARKLVRYGGFALLGLVTFVFAFQLTFPYGRVKDRVIDALSSKYEVSIGDVERGIMPGRMYFKAISLRTRPEKADDVATTFYIEQLEVDLGILALIEGTVAVKLDAKIGPGHIAGSVAVSKSGTSIDITGSDLPSASLPMREVIGLPMSGTLRFAVALELPNDKLKTGRVGPNWPKAEGSLSLACPSSCVIGDGKTKLKPKIKNNVRSQAMAEAGIDFGKVNVDSLFATVEIKNGKVDVTKFDTKSGDGELKVEFDMTLNQDVNASLVTGCLRFRGSEALLKREPKTHSAISLTGAPLGPDNLFHIKLDGPLREVRRLGQVCGAAANTSMDNPGATARPPTVMIPDRQPTITVPDRPSGMVNPVNPVNPGGTALPPTTMVPELPPRPQVTPPLIPSPKPYAPDDAGAIAVPQGTPQGEVVTPGAPVPPPTGAALDPGSAGSGAPR